ncbi:HAD hydrolase family protein [Brevibacterium litoralis]|uniref:HAD hydrolase family protein n=1 Tax=Brevibacterium litoralis TaxID=3138935 RepID=UPI0032EDBB49
MTPAAAASADHRVVFLDVDGTILDEDGNIPASTTRAIRHARASGHRVFLATGRVPREIFPELAALGFDGAVTGAGAYARVGARTVFARAMTRPQLREMVDVFVAADLMYNLQGPDFTHPTPAHQEEMARRYTALGRADAQSLAFGDTVRPLDPGVLPDTPVSKAVFTGTRDDAYDRVVAGLGPDFEVITGTLPGLGTRGGEVSLAGVDKSAGVRAVLADLGVPVERAVAIGDNNNDLQMLRYVGTGVAMGNGTPEAKEAADLVTDPVDADGVAHAFERLGLV